VPLDANTRRAVNEEQVRLFFSWWDPTWRWILIVGLRDLRANLGHLGDLANGEMGNDSWSDESYVYGPLALGITASAVNEAAQHCEDLFALLSFLRDSQTFARQMGSYSAGKVIKLADRLEEETDAQIARRFCIPPIDSIQDGMQKAEDPESSVGIAWEGLSRLGRLARSVVAFYKTYEFFHLQYKHGLKVLFRPFGVPTADAISERKGDLRAPLFAASNEPISKMLKRPQSQQTMMFQLTPHSQPHLNELVASRDLLRPQMAGPEVDLNDVVAHSWTVSRLLRLAQANRLALGELDEHRQQTFHLPGAGLKETIEIRIEPATAIALRDVAG
jgi:hypothetical protein